MIIKDTIIRDMGRLFIWYPFRWIISLSPYRIVRSFSFIMGFIDHHFCKSRRIQLITNLNGVFGNNINVKNIALRIMQTHYLNLLELFKFSSLNKTNIYNHVDIEGISNLDQAISKGKGVILATLHFGTMQYPLIALGILGHTINQVGDRDTEAPEFSYIHRKIALKHRTIIENKFNAKHIHISKSLNRIYKCLQDSELLMINVDGVGGLKGQRLKSNYLKIRFMGNDVYVPAGAVRVARKTGSPIVPIVCIRQDNGQHKIVIDPPIIVKSSADINLDIQDYTQQILSHFESYIKTYPDHWLLWMEFKKGYMIV